MSDSNNEKFGEARTGIPVEEDFEALFEASQQQSDAGVGAHVSPGEVVKGHIVSIGRETVFVDLGGKSEGCLSIVELQDEDGELTAQVGDEVEAYVISVRDGVQLSKALAKSAQDAELLQTAFDEKIPVEGTVSGVNKGGVEVQVAGNRAFCPVSQLDLDFVPDPSVYVGQTFQFVIQRMEGGKRPNIVLSRRVLLEAEKAEKAAETRKLVVEGALLKGKVRNIRDFGAFVDLGGLDGLVHVSELSWERVSDPKDVVKIGDEVEVKVLKADWEKGRISLSMREAQPDPWASGADRFSPGTDVPGTVVRLADFGAFVEIGPGMDGLVHLSELSWKRVQRAEDVLSPGQSVTVRILEVDPARRRISLSLKQATGDDPWATAAASFPAGKVVEGTVEKIESFGVFVELAPGLTGLLPVSESDTERGSDLRRHFPIGSKVTAKVLSVSPDERRLSLSRKALSESADRENIETYQRNAGRDSGSKGGGGGFGTFGDLLKGKLDLDGKK